MKDALNIFELMKWLVIRSFAVLALVTLGTRGFVPAAPGALTAEERGPDSVSFPRHGATNTMEDILEQYSDYLRFALTVGRDVDRATAHRLEVTFEALRKQDPEGAARFLRGLRFEMLQKLELLGLPESAVNTSTPIMRRWIAKFLPTWAREADEYLFRARTASIARK
jgi:hypothetical protein